MKTKNNLCTTMLCAMLFLLSACGVPNTQTNACIQPLSNSFSYPSIGSDNPKRIIPGQDLIVVPSHTWQVETSLPNMKEIKRDEYDYQSIWSMLQTRNMKNYTEIWIYIALFDPDHNGTYYLGMYRTDTKNWQIIPAQIDTLFVDKSGMLWGSNSSRLSDSRNASDSVLSKFDEQNGIFKPELNVQNISSGITESEMYYYSKVLLDKQGIFWILASNDAIYSYNPKTGEVKRRIDMPFIAKNAQLAPDGSIYIFSQPHWSEPFGQDKFIHQFFPNTNKMDKFRVSLEPYPFIQNMLVDHLGRLWLDNSGYRDENGIWYQLQRSPVFYSSQTEGGNDFGYKNAKILLESSDGRLWFLHHNNGMIYLDPDKGEWCWFTTYQSNIVEDQQHNLWMIADGKLYQYPLKP